jgi:NADH-quinone oxidoreductase subunit J
VSSSVLLSAAQAVHDPTAAETGIFWVLAPVMVLAALGLLFVRSAVHAALSVAVVMVGLGIVYLVQDAPFLGVVQIFVYTGAVMMLFLFVIMLIGVSSAASLVETFRRQRIVGVLLGGGFAALLVWILAVAAFDPAVGLVQVNQRPGNITGIAYLIFSDFVWVFELTSVLLITAALGAMVLTHRERLSRRASQRELSVLRIAEGPVKGPLPGPGVFARHNAVGTPAMLPDGTVCEASISRVLSVRGQAASIQEALETNTSHLAVEQTADGVENTGDRGENAGRVGADQDAGARTPGKDGQQ